MKEPKENYALVLGKRLTDRQKIKQYIPKYLKPKVRDESPSQYPFRCPICWTKHLFKSQGQECVDQCWDELPELVWKALDEKDKNPKETGSWQWDIDDSHRDSCGIVEYNNGDVKPYKTYGNNIVFISMNELVKLLKKGCKLWQKGHIELPTELKPFEDAERPKPKDKSTMALFKGLSDEV